MTSWRKGACNEFFFLGGNSWFLSRILIYVYEQTPAAMSWSGADDASIVYVFEIPTDRGERLLPMDLRAGENWVG